jgi:hypothetical protein
LTLKWADNQQSTVTAGAEKKITSDPARVASMDLKAETILRGAAAYDICIFCNHSLFTWVITAKTLMRLPQKAKNTYLGRVQGKVTQPLS